MGSILCLAVLGYVADMLNRIVGIQHYCSYAGKCHHLLWGPDTDTELFEPWVQVVYYLTYLGPFPLLVLLGKFDDLRPLPCCKEATQGHWAGLGITVIGLGTWAPTYLDLLRETPQTLQRDPLSKGGGPCVSCFSLSHKKSPPPIERYLYFNVIARETCDPAEWSSVW